MLSVVAQAAIHLSPFGLTVARGFNFALRLDLVRALEQHDACLSRAHLSRVHGFLLARTISVRRAAFSGDRSQGPPKFSARSIHALSSQTAYRSARSNSTSRPARHDALASCQVNSTRHLGIRKIDR